MMYYITLILGIGAMIAVGEAHADDKGPDAAMKINGPVFATPMSRETAQQAMKYLKGENADPPPLAFKVPADRKTVLHCEFPPLNRINVGIRCADVGQTLVCPKEIPVRLPSGDTVIREVECDLGDLVYLNAFYVRDDNASETET